MAKLANMLQLRKGDDAEYKSKSSLKHSGNGYF